MAPTLKNIRFGRRKSQGNSMDDGSPTAPVSSFRVIPREDNARKSTATALDLRKAATFQPTRQSSYEYDSGSSNRGSNSSASTAARSHLFDNANTRFSSTSTLQSPVEAMKKDRSPSPGFLKLGDDFDNDWGDLFSGVDKRKSHMDREPSPRPLTTALRADSEPILSNPPKAFSHNPSTSPPLGYAQRREMTASPPTQWARRKSTDRLITSPELGSIDSPIDDEPPPVPPKHTTTGKGPKSYSYFQLEESSDFLEEPPKLGHTASVRSQDSYTRSGANEDADAAFVRQSVRALRASTIERSGVMAGSPLARKEMTTSESLAPPTSRPLNSSDASLKTTSSTSSTAQKPVSPASTPSVASVEYHDSARSTPRATAKADPPKEDVDDQMFDPEVMQAIHQANNRSMLGLPNESPASPSRPSGARVMSMAEFNKQRANVPYTTTSKQPTDNDSDDGYEDDDDDPAVQAQKRRMEAQKEAQHAVWRQKMKKAIGDHSTMPPLRPDFARANQSAPSLMFNGEPQPDDEEDDDVPLAILQAHNFPGKNKSPDPRMSQSSFVGIQDRPGTPTRQAGQRGSQLPVFARRLPEDPYFGTSDLAQPSNRESLAFNTGRASSIYGGRAAPPPGTSPVPGVPPGGLVGVIAEEERARGARRGSPNAQTGMGFNMPGHGVMGGGMPMQMPMMPMGSSGSMAQQQDAVRNQQMLELMQQNSFMMKEMMEMRAQMQMFQMGGPMPQGMPMPGLPQSRPMSLADQNSNRQSMAPSTYGRTMSFMGPAPTMFLNQQAAPIGSGARSVRGMSFSNYGAPGYTPSIAPSERSNIGQPSRYKPVNFGDGGSTVTAGSAPRLSQSQPLPGNEKKKSGFLSAVMHQGKKSMSRAHNVDDEEEWGAARRRR